jgi:hypothetical protein
VYVIVLRLVAALRLLIAYQSQPAYFFSPERLYLLMKEFIASEGSPT